MTDRVGRFPPSAETPRARCGVCGELGGATAFQDSRTTRIRAGWFLPPCVALKPSWLELVWSHGVAGLAGVHNTKRIPFRLARVTQFSPMT